MKNHFVLLCLVLWCFVANVNAQYDVQSLKSDLKSKDNKIFSYKGKEFDYLYLLNVSDAAKKQQNDAILCIDKKGGVAYEISVTHPANAEFYSLYEGDGHLMLMYSQEIKNENCILMNRMEKRNIKPEWNPEVILQIPDKHNDVTDCAVSPDGSYFVVGGIYRPKKKQPYTAKVTVINSKGNKQYDRSTFLTTKWTKMYNVNMRVSNDGVSYCSFIDYDPKTYNSDIVAYIFNEQTCFKASAFFGLAFYYKTPFNSVVTNSGDLIMSGINSNLTPFVSYYNNKTKLLSTKTYQLDDQSRAQLESSIARMYSASSNKSDGKWIETCAVHEFEDGSIAVLYEPEAGAHREYQKTNTYTYKDKKGVTHTNTITTTERVDYIHWSGCVLVGLFDKNLETKKFVVCDKFQTWTGSDRRYKNLDGLSHMSFMSNDKLKVVYFDASNEGDKWNMFTIKNGGIIQNSQKVIDYTKADFKIRNIDFTYDNYWIVRLYGENKKRRNNLSIIHFDTDKNSSEKIDDSEESPELF